MQFIVFAAFAIVLSVPEGGPPWPRITSSPGTLWIVIGQMVLAALVGTIWTRLVLIRLEADPAWLPSAERRLSHGNAVLRMLLAIGLVVSVYFTNWVKMVRAFQIPLSGDRSISVASIWGLDELIILLPFFISIVLAWITFYPADRAVRQVALELRLWASVPAPPPAGLAIGPISEFSVAATCVDYSAADAADRGRQRFCLYVQQTDSTIHRSGLGGSGGAGGDGGFGFSAGAGDVGLCLAYACVAAQRFAAIDWKIFASARG